MKQALIKALTVVLGVEAILVSISMFFPNGKIGNNDLSLTWVAPENIFATHTEEIMDTTSVQDTSLTANATLLNENLDPGDIAYEQDSIYAEDTMHTDFWLFNPERHGRKAMDSFFESLSSAHQDSQIIRIAHYGDSQIEGDRVTGYIRFALHKEFHGGGLGIIPLTEAANHHSVTRIAGPAWRRYTMFQNRYTNSFYGIGGTVFRFQPAKKKANADSLSHLPEVTSEYKMQFVKGTKYKKMKLLWGQAPTQWKLKTIVNDTIVIQDSFPASKNFEISEINVPANALKIKFQMTAAESPDFYGVAVDGKGGVTIDNFAIRGHSGNGLLLINSEWLENQYKALNHKLIVLQFGGNVVPYASKNFKWLEDEFYKMIIKIKRAAPQASILVVAVADMGRSYGGGWSSYPTVPRIRDAQRRASLRAGVAFWDFYEIMGGKNAIVDWVNKGWALNDYAHFSNSGQKKLSEHFMEMLLDEFDNWKSEKEKSNDKKVGK